MKITKILLFTIFSFLFIACSDKSINLNQNSLPFPSASLEKTIIENRTTRISLDKSFSNFYKEWKGVKYKFGGSTKKGIDCSSFIQKAYRKTLDIRIPRTTLLQSRIGKNIKKSQLQLGDLVFFKTGKNSRHVGIYIENGEFMHASSKRGVSISKLDNIYFNKHYWKSQRIIH
jgi:hypothetical protein